MTLSTLMTSTEVCELLKVSRRSLSRMQTEGIIRPVRVGKSKRYKASDIELIIQYYGEDLTVLNCECGGPCYCSQPMNSWPEAAKYGSHANHKEFPDDPDDHTHCDNAAAESVE